LFESLNIKTDILYDLGIMDLIRATRKFIEDEAFVDASMSVFVLMAHGDDNSIIYTANGGTIKADEIIELFDETNCPNLKGKPKWFIFQVERNVFCQL